MSITTKKARQAVHALIQEWFLPANVPPEFDCPIAQENIVGYFTQPLETADSPNWIILYSTHSLTSGVSLGGDIQNAQLGILLACSLSKGANAEASREAAENWLDDAEEYILQRLAQSKTADWRELRAVTPKRDKWRTMWRRFRTSDILLFVEKR